MNPLSQKLSDLSVTDIPKFIQVPVEYLSSRHGIPPGTVALALLSTLGGVMSAGRRINLGGTHPLGLHVGLLAPTTCEGHGLIAFIAAPLRSEVARLQSVAKTNPEISSSLEVLGKELNQARARQNDVSLALTKAYREMAVILHPHLIIEGLPNSRTRDGLSAPIIIDNQGTWLADSPPQNLAPLANTFSGEPGMTTTLLATIRVDAAVSLLASRLFTQTPSWPLLFLPQSGGDIKNTSKEQGTHAEEVWQLLVQKALLVRYEQPVELLVADDALKVLSETKSSPTSATGDRKQLFLEEVRPQATAIQHPIFQNVL